MIENIKILSEICGVSGDESLVRKAIIEKIGGKATVQIDNLGNIICFKKGKKTPSKKLIITAHMDEVGLIVTNITDDGYIKFATVGGIDPKVLPFRNVKFTNSDIAGVIATKILHSQVGEQRKAVMPVDKLFIDIGATSKEEVQKYINIGDTICFADNYCELGENLIKAKALDDRAGCALLLKLIEDKLEYDMFLVFTTQEEVGLNGASVAANSLNPDYAIVVETTTAADIEGVSGEKTVCKLGEGAVVGFMDKRTIYDKKLYALAYETAKENGIKIQTKTMVAGGNEAGVIQTSNGGVRTIAVNMPCRYLHSASCVLNKSDIDETYNLIKVLSAKILEE